MLQKQSLTMYELCYIVAAFELQTGGVDTTNLE